MRLLCRSLIQDAAQRSGNPSARWDAKDAYTAALERDTLADYESFLAAYPDDPMAKRVRAIIAAHRVKPSRGGGLYRADTSQAYWSYLRRYPRGPHAADARRRLAIIAAALEPPPTFDEVFAFDVPPPPPEELGYFDQPVLMFGEPGLRLRRHLRRPRCFSCHRRRMISSRWSRRLSWIAASSTCRSRSSFRSPFMSRPPIYVRTRRSTVSCSPTSTIRSVIDRIINRRYMWGWAE